MNSLFIQSRTLHRALDDYCEYIRDIDASIRGKYVSCVKYRYRTTVFGFTACMIITDVPATTGTCISRSIICYRRLWNTTYDNFPHDT